MAYLGNDLQVAYQSYQIIDDISSSFNGVLTTFPLQVGGVTPVPFPINPQQCLISVNGVIQEPDPSGTSGFNLVGSNIVFSSAPTGGHAFFGVILAGADYVNVGVNYPSGSESAPSITFDTDLDTGIYNPAANELGFSTNSIQRLKIESDGDINIDSGGVFYDATNNRLAIGTTTVNTTLEVLNSSAPIIRVGDGIRHVELRGGSTVQNAGVGTNYPGTFDIIQNGSAAVTIDASKRILVGTSSAGSVLTNTVELAGAGTNPLDQPAYQIYAYPGTANTNTGYFQFYRSASGTLGTNTSVGNADRLGMLRWSGADGTNYISAAEIYAEVDGTPGVSDMPGRLIFSTTANGASTPTERMRISSGGKLTAPGVYAGTTTGGGPVYVESDGDLLRFTSSRKYKTDIETLEDSRADAILNCRPVWYRSLSENDIKTEGADKSEWGWYGFIAEEVAEIDPRLVNWATKDAVVQEDGSTKSVERDPADYEAEGVRYETFVPLLLNLIKRQKEQIEAMEARLSALEAN